MLEALNKFKMTSDWKKEKGQYIPYPASWLNQKRWEDEFNFEIDESKTENNHVEIDSEVEKRFMNIVGAKYE